MNTKVDTILRAMQQLSQSDKTETQDQDQGLKASANTTKSGFNNLDVVVAPISLTLCRHLSLHSTLVFDDPVILEAKTLARQDLSRAIKLFFYSLQVLIWEYA